MASLIQQSNVPAPAKALRGFENISRYWDRGREIYTAKILPGDYYVTTNDELIVTVLGSCVSACIRDPAMGIGGMNHFMLPAGTSDESRLGLTSDATRYGNFAMERLINDILKNGGRRDHLEIKLFGGGKVIQHMKEMDVGARNVKFALEYLKTEGLSAVAKDLGDIFPRKVVYMPLTGKVMVKRLRSLHNETITEQEKSYLNAIQKPIAGDIELFD